LSLGGDSTWREYLTLPNLLKEYNPNLRGFSTGTGEWLAKNARLNVAFPVASDQDAFKQAKVLFFLIKFDVGLISVLAFPRDSNMIIVNWWYTTVGPGYTGTWCSVKNQAKDLEYILSGSLLEQVLDLKSRSPQFVIHT
jgi:hypothetical protein